MGGDTDIGIAGVISRRIHLEEIQQARFGTMRFLRRGYYEKL